MEEKALPFLAVGRVKDQVILATFCEMVRGQEQTEIIFKRLLEASKAKLAPGQRQRLQWGNGSVCCLLDMQGESLYCLITAQMEYPERLAYQLLNELNQHVYQNHGQEVASSPNGISYLDCKPCALNRPLQPFMEKLIRQYEDPKSFDRICMLTTKTNVVRSVMQDSVRKVVETGESLQELELKAGRMSEQSRQFSTTSREVRRHFWWKNKKLCIAGGLVVGIVVIILVFSLRTPKHAPKLLATEDTRRFNIIMESPAATPVPPHQLPTHSQHTATTQQQSTQSFLVPSTNTSTNTSPTTLNNEATVLSPPTVKDASTVHAASTQKSQSNDAAHINKTPSNSIVLINRSSAPTPVSEAVFMINPAQLQEAMVERGPLMDSRPSVTAEDTTAVFNDKKQEEEERGGKTIIA